MVIFIIVHLIFSLQKNHTVMRTRLLLSSFLAKGYVTIHFSPLTKDLWRTAP